MVKIPSFNISINAFKHLIGDEDDSKIGRIFLFTFTHLLLSLRSTRQSILHVAVFQGNSQIRNRCCAFTEFLNFLKKKICFDLRCGFPFPFKGTQMSFWVLKCFFIVLSPQIYESYASSFSVIYSFMWRYLNLIGI